jgi:hypothetical protein
VEEETVDRSPNHPDAVLIKENIRAGHLKVRDAGKGHLKGEDAVLSMFNSGGFNAVGTDDARFISISDAHRRWNAMITKTLRLSEGLADAIRELGETEHIEEATAMRKLLLMGYEMHLAEQYRAGRLCLRDVATRLNRSLGDTLEYLQYLGISGNAGAADTLASFASLEG